MQPRSTDPGPFLFNQFDLFLHDLKWLCEFAALLEERKKEGAETARNTVGAGLIIVYGVLALFATWCCPKIVFQGKLLLIVVINIIHVYIAGATALCCWTYVTEWIEPMMRSYIIEL